MKTLQSITLSGQIKGRIWMPAVECLKDFTVRFTPDNQPFSRPWSELEDAINHITNDGHFQSCYINDLWIEVKYLENVNHRTQLTAICNEINPNAKILQDYIHKDVKESGCWLYQSFDE